VRYLNKEALNIILGVQALRTFAIYDTEINAVEGGWYKRCEKYYNSVPDHMMAKAGLHKNVNDYRLALDYQVTEQMKSTDYEALNQFILSQWDS
jgi:hypothetical protein